MPLPFCIEHGQQDGKFEGTAGLTEAKHGSREASVASDELPVHAGFPEGRKTGTT